MDTFIPIHTFTIHGRQYVAVQATPMSEIVVTGQCRTRAGALMPRLEEQLLEAFEAHEIPASLALVSVLTQLVGTAARGEPSQSLTFPFHKGKAQKIAYRAFRTVAEADPIFRDKRCRAGVIMRRFRLAKLAGLHLGCQVWYRNPLDEIKAEMVAYLDVLFRDFGHPLKAVLEVDPGLVRYWLTEIPDPSERCLKIRLEPGDREWLEARVMEVLLRAGSAEIARSGEEL